MVITPDRGWFELHLDEIWRYRDLLWIFVKRDFTTFYKQTILGPLWFFIQPLISTIVFTIIFNRVAGLPTDAIPPFLFYMSGIIAWNYFSSCLTSTSGTFTVNAGLFGKVYFPRIIVPLSMVISGLFRFGVQLLMFFGFYFYYIYMGNQHINPSFQTLLLIPIMIIQMAMYIFVAKISKGEPISVFNHGKMERDFTYIDDIITGTKAAIDKNYPCEVFNLGNNNSEDLMEMVGLIESEIGKKAEIQFEGMQPGDVKRTFADIEHSKQKLNYTPTTKIVEGIPKFIEWYLTYS